MTKGARALNTSATKFEVPSHASERDERSEARAVREGLSRGGSLRGMRLDTMQECVELTKETLQCEALYILCGWNSAAESIME